MLSVPVYTDLSPLIDQLINQRLSIRDRECARFLNPFKTKRFSKRIFRWVYIIKHNRRSSNKRIKKEKGRKEITFRRDAGFLFSKGSIYRKSWLADRRIRNFKHNAS